jgi:hypothetical protein
LLKPDHHREPVRLLRGPKGPLQALSWHGAFLIKGLGFAQSSIGLLGALPAGASVILAISTGWFSQRLLARGVSRRLARGIFGGACVAFGGATLAMMPFVPSIPAKIALTTIGRDARDGSQVCLKERTAVRPLLLFPGCDVRLARRRPDRVPANPASAVRGPKHVVKTGTTPVLEAEEWRKLLDSISTVMLRDLRDRALIATLTYSFARINAALKTRRSTPISTRRALPRTAKDFCSGPRAATTAMHYPIRPWISPPPGA